MAKGAIATKRALRESGDRLFENCHWCGIECIWFQKLDPDSILNTRTPEGGFKINGGGIIRYKTENGKTVHKHIVSIDHLLELSKGGGNEPENIVFACVPCNSRRSSPSGRSPLCIRCEEPKKKRRRFCVKCQREMQEEYLREHELWDENRHLHTNDKLKHPALAEQLKMLQSPRAQCSGIGEKLCP